MRDLAESSLADLYASAVLAFPKTTKRQHATGPIVIEDLRMTPFLGMKTLFVRAEAVNGDRRYAPVVLLRGVNYGGAGAKIRASDDMEYEFDRLSLGESDVNVRCNCADFLWRFNYYDYQDRSLYGNKRKKYESKGGPPANPLQLPGMCKHLMRLMETLQQMRLLAD